MRKLGSLYENIRVFLNQFLNFLKVRKKLTVQGLLDFFDGAVISRTAFYQIKIIVFSIWKKRKSIFIFSGSL